jgi:hypothetical protein
MSNNDLLLFYRTYERAIHNGAYFDFTKLETFTKTDERWEKLIAAREALHKELVTRGMFK